MAERSKVQAPPPPPENDPSPESGGDRRLRREGTRQASRAIKAQYAARRSFMDVVADRLTRIASSTPFLFFHVVWFAVWIGGNLGLFGGHRFDPFPFGLLTMVVSLEAIFLSIFVLMVQGREAEIAELREEITLQVNLRMEEEVTKTLQLVAGLYQRLGFSLGDDPDLRAMIQPLDADQIERELVEQIDQAQKQAPRELFKPKTGAPPPQR